MSSSSVLFRNESLPLSFPPSRLADLPPLPDDSSEGPIAMSPGSPCSVTGVSAATDLRFHQLHGANAVITNGGRTALRQNCRSEFNDAIVISNRCVLTRYCGHLLFFFFLRQTSNKNKIHRTQDMKKNFLFHFNQFNQKKEPMG